MFFDRIFKWTDDGNGNLVQCFSRYTIIRISPVEIVVLDHVYQTIASTHWATVDILTKMVPFVSGDIGKYILKGIAVWN